LAEAQPIVLRRSNYRVSGLVQLQVSRNHVARRTKRCVQANAFLGPRWIIRESLCGNTFALSRDKHMKDICRARIFSDDRPSRARSCD